MKSQPASATELVCLCDHIYRVPSTGSRSEAACYITEDTLSDQGCLSATSLCSESGYQSDDRYVAAPLHQEEEADQVSAHTVLSISAASSQTSVVAIPMETLDFSEVVENEDVNNVSLLGTVFM